MLRLVQQRTIIEVLRTSTSKSVVSNRYLHSTSISNALTKFTMPAMSPTMTEGGIASWKKKEGESFAPGDVLVEIETDKATMDVEAQDEGLLAKIIVGDGSKAVPVGSSIAILAEEGDDISASAIEALLAESSEAPVEVAQEAEKVETKQPEAPKEVTPPTPSSSSSSAPSTSSSTSSSSSTASSSTYVLASPMAKRMALEQGIPLSAIKGTGPGGRVVKVDIENYKPAPAAAPTPVASTSASAPPTKSTSAPSSSSSSASSASSTASYTDTPVSNMRRTIASRLTESKSGTPHYYLTVEVNMDKVIKLRALFNNAAKNVEIGSMNDGVKGGVKLSVNDFIVKACSLALQDVPEVNSGWHGEFVRHYHTQDISIAVATPNGLITPIIRNAGAKGLATVSAETKALAIKARDGKLKPEEYQGGSFTISNLGMMGIESFTAIVNPPQSCILAIGASEKKLVLDESSEKGFKEINVMKVTMSCDHRVVDGAVGAKWMKSFKAYLESPLSFML